MGMRKIEDHTEMLTLLVCKVVRSYMSENPGMVHTEVLQSLSNTIYAVAGAIDDWFEQVEVLVGTKVSEECETPDFTEFLHFSNDLQENLEDTEYDDGYDDEDDDD